MEPGRRPALDGEFAEAVIVCQPMADIALGRTLIPLILTEGAAYRLRMFLRMLPLCSKQMFFSYSVRWGYVVKVFLFQSV